MSKHAGPGDQPWSVSALARLFRLDRGTVARRLERVTPAKLNNRVSTPPLYHIYM